MTIEEVAAVYGVDNVSPSTGQTITDMVRIIYGEHKEIYFDILRRLNKRTDWFNLEPQIDIDFIKKEFVNKITE